MVYVNHILIFQLYKSTTEKVAITTLYIWCIQLTLLFLLFIKKSILCKILKYALVLYLACLCLPEVLLSVPFKLQGFSSV